MNFKRRYLKPYLNPLELMKKYEKHQMELSAKIKYKITVKTASGTNTGTNATVITYLLRIIYYRLKK